MLIRRLSVRLGFRLVLKSEIVVFGLLIYTRQQSGLAFCSTDMSDHVLGSWKVNCGSGHSFRITVFLLGLENLMVGCPVVLSPCFVFGPSERFPQSY